MNFQFQGVIHSSLWEGERKEEERQKRMKKWKNKKCDLEIDFSEIFAQTCENEIGKWYKFMKGIFLWIQFGIFQFLSAKFF